MIFTKRKKGGRKQKGTIQKRRSKKHTFRKHRTRRRGGVATEKKTKKKVDWSERAGVSASTISRTSRQEIMARKKEADAREAAEKAALEATGEAERKAKRAEAARVKALKEKNTRDTAMAAQTRYTPRTGRSTALDLTRPEVIKAIWYRNFETPLKLVAEEAKRKAEEKGYTGRRVNHEVHMAVLAEYNKIFRGNRIHGLADHFLTRILTDKYYKDKTIVSAAVLIRFYQRTMDSGENIPEKAINRLKGYAKDPVIMAGLTHDEKMVLAAIIDRHGVGFHELPDLHDLPDLEDLDFEKS